MTKEALRGFISEFNFFRGKRKEICHCIVTFLVLFLNGCKLEVQEWRRLRERGKDFVNGRVVVSELDLVVLQKSANERVDLHS